MHEEGIEYPGLAGFRVITTDADGLVQVRIVGDPAPEVDAAAVEARWSELCAANPRLHDGRMLSVVSISHDPQSRAGCGLTTVVARVGSYKALAVEAPGAGSVETGTDQLSVTAIVMGRDAAGRPHVLMGQRGTGTRLYGGMWELGPSGGVDAPEQGVDLLTDDEVVRVVRQEIGEELGASVRVGVEGLRAITHDPLARSYDLCFVCWATGAVRSGMFTPETAGEPWEYPRAAWVPCDQLSAFERLHAGQIIGPTRALLRFMRWVEP